jgi:hypothetical protein
MTLSTVTGGNTYYFKVIASNAYGDGTESAEVNAFAATKPD